VSSLERSGWGELRGRRYGSARTLLQALATKADARSGVVTMTAAQAAEWAGTSPRTMLRAWGALEGLGVLERLVRGGRRGTTAVASVWRVSKRALLAFVPGARIAKAARAARENLAAITRTRHLPNVPRRHAFIPFGKSTHGRASGTRPVTGEWASADRCDHGAVVGRCALCRRGTPS
jgi:hypothetical protein